MTLMRTRNTPDKSCGNSSAPWPRLSGWRLAVVLLVLTFASVGAIAADRVVHQRGRAFSVDTMNVPLNQPVIFLNDDTVPHNIMSTSADNAFDLGSQSPGDATPVSFSVAGSLVVICAIHPRMHLTIIVAP